MLEFQLQPRKEDRKTDTWNILNKSYIHLGSIHWWPAWRRYIFSPTNQPVFDASCLAEILDFIEKQMLARKENAPSSPLPENRPRTR